MIRLLIADDHPIVREGLMRIVATHHGITVVAHTADGDAVVRHVEQTPVDVVLLDITMPGPGFIEVIHRVKRLRPRLPILVLSIHPEQPYAVRALRAGADGYLTKRQSPEQLVQAIIKVYQGGKYVSSAVAEDLAHRLRTDPPDAAHETLSNREFQVLCRLGTGRKVRDVAAELTLSVRTVNTYRERIREKLRLCTNAELVRYAVEHNLLS
jgi:DNA-binding NarL/FixJ family response regulator